MNGEPRDNTVTTADFAAAAGRPASSTHHADQPVLQAINADGVTETTIKEGAMAPLFSPDAAMQFRSRWDVVQRSFVDDPRAAVHAADELVVQVAQSLAESFAKQRSDLDSGRDKTGAPTTENLRLALRRHRSFFERLLSI